jgi:hypothetical protein
MPETQYELITRDSGSSHEVIERIVEAEKEILKDAAKQQGRAFPYVLEIKDSKGQLAREVVGDSAKRDAIIAGQRIDGSSWRFSARPDLGAILPQNIAMVLNSGVEWLVRKI